MRKEGGGLTHEDPRSGELKRAHDAVDEFFGPLGNLSRVHAVGGFDVEHSNLVLFKSANSVAEMSSLFGSAAVGMTKMIKTTWGKALGAHSLLVVGEGRIQKIETFGSLGEGKTSSCLHNGVRNKASSNRIEPMTRPSSLQPS